MQKLQNRCFRTENFNIWNENFTKWALKNKLEMSEEWVSELQDISISII